MANNFRNPWVLDTTGAITTGVVLLGSISFQGYSTAGHKAILKDAAGRTISELVGVTSLEPITVSFEGGMNPVGLTLDTLGSGRVVVEVL